MEKRNLIILHTPINCDHGSGSSLHTETFGQRFVIMEFYRDALAYLHTYRNSLTRQSKRQKHSLVPLFEIKHISYLKRAQAALNVDLESVYWFSNPFSLNNHSILTVQWLKCMMLFENGQESVEFGLVEEVTHWTGKLDGKLWNSRHLVLTPRGLGGLYLRILV